MPNRVLPKGRYWFTANHDDQFGTWQGWLDAFKANVHVEVTESYTPGTLEEGSAYEFYIFTTDKDLIWERGDFPTVAGPNVKSKADTLDRPEPQQDITDQINDALEKAKESAAQVGKVAVGVLVGLAILVGGSVLLRGVKRR